jgi:hypothetical protein
MRRLIFLAAALAIGADWGGGAAFAVTPDPVFQLPLALPLESGAAVTRTAKPSNGWESVSFVAGLPAVVLAGSNPAARVTVPAGTRWFSDGAEAGSLILTTVVQRIILPYSPVFDFAGSGSTGPAFSVAGWVWMKDATWFTLACKADGREWLFGLDRQDRLGLTLSSGGGDEKKRWTRLSPPLTADEGAWHHYVAVVEQGGSAPRVVLYRDGEPLAEGVTEVRGEGFEGLKSHNEPITLGSGPLMRARSKGLLGGLSIWNLPLAAESVKELYARGKAELQSHRTVAAELDAVFPGEREIELGSRTPWHQAEALRLNVSVPAGAPTNCEALVYVKDWNYLWYQHLVPGCLTPGVSTQVVVSLAPDSEAWQTVGHDFRWNGRTLADPRSVGVRLFCKDSAWTGRVSVAAPEIRLKPAIPPPPAFRDVRPETLRTPKDEKFEVSFRIPDRHRDPFDTNEVHVTAEFTAPDGVVTVVDGFYANDYYREETPAGEAITPQGVPLWRVRYAPRQEGVHQYRLKVRDAGGEAVWGPARFTATPAVSRGFVRVSARDPRFFEFTDGSYYFPIGHNVRSPFDTRHDAAFPWEQRFEAGTAVYRKYFAAMADHGEQLAEVWFAPWSLGLEWDERWPGYHGVGQYNMRHAWEMDRVVDEAAARGIQLNMVIHNHGKFSTFSDPEFQDNPFNADNGGYLMTPNEYFTDPRAQESFRKLMRYTVARWGYSRQVLAWQLWSELDLVGADRSFYRKPECVAWHQAMGRYLKEIDPNRHLVATHVCGDFNNQNPEIISKPEMDHCAVDAYHGSPDPVFIVSLMKATAQFNNPFLKPVQITEFGGQWSASSMAHLRATLHAAVWGSVGVPLAGTPMLWWWMAIDEENLYPVFRGVAAYMKDVDRRDPELLPADPVFSGGGVPGGELVWTCLRSPRLVLGWVCRSPEFETVDLNGPPKITELQAELSGLTNGTFRVEYWDTARGTPAQRLLVASTNGVLKLTLPPFVRDAAFKARLEP